MLIMASGIVGGSISTVVEQAPSGFERSAKQYSLIMENHVHRNREVCVFTYQSICLHLSQTKRVSSRTCITKNEDIQFYWAILSQDINDPELLGEIIKLWITVRGFSITATWMEVYKKKEYKKQLGLERVLVVQVHKINDRMNYHVKLCVVFKSVHM